MIRWRVFWIIYILSLIPILSTVFDYGEWDEAGYTLASEANFNYLSYQNYDVIVPLSLKDRSLKPPFIQISERPWTATSLLRTYVYPYPNILYSWTLGAFSRMASLPPDHHTRFLFICILLSVLSFSMLFFSFFVLSKTAPHLSPWVLGGVTIFSNSLLWITLFELKGAQLGATCLFIFCLLFLYQYHLSPSRQRFLFLAVGFLFLSYLWKEQIFPLLFLFFWLFPPASRKKRLMQYAGYALSLCLLFLLFYGILSQFSFHAGLPTTHYYYSSENRAWAPQFRFESWIKILLQMPLFYFLVTLSIVFVYKKDYQRFFLLENKLFFLGVLYFLVTTVFYFYQSIDYLAGINYVVVLISCFYFFSRISYIGRAFTPAYLVIFSFILWIPVISGFYQNYHMPRAIPLIFSQKSSQLFRFPCVDTEYALYALNQPVLGSIYVRKDLQNRPFLNYANMTEKEFLQALQIYQPAIIMFRMDGSEYPLSDGYMRIYRMRKKIKAQNVEYGLGGDIANGIFFFVRQSPGKKV